MVFRYFHNENLSVTSNSILWWVWESVIHHIYFLVLFVQRQFSENWGARENLYKVNMEKECEFFSLLFGGNAEFCAEATSSLFAGLWFRISNPNEKHLHWIGRLITNYQHSEAIFHAAIVFSGLAIIYQLGSVSRPTKQVAANVPLWLRWIFFAAMAFETYTMCVPYLFLFSWVWTPFITEPKDGLVHFIEGFNNGDSFLTGMQFGAALITMFWVSVVVLVLDYWALTKAWQLLRNGKSNPLLGYSIIAILGGIIVYLIGEFFSPHGRAGSHHDEASYTEIVGDWLHHLYGDDFTPMRSLMSKPKH